jgi:protein-tyrosine phosphatase
MTRRAIMWEGFFNARDLGGLPVADGRMTRFGAFVRSADLRFVTEHGWQQAHGAGMRTVLDLRNNDEVSPSDGARLTERVPGSSQFLCARCTSSPRTRTSRVRV